LDADEFLGFDATGCWSRDVALKELQDLCLEADRED
jgi:hypothetical protein